VVVLCVQPLSREEQHGPGFHYIVRWRLREQDSSVSGSHNNEFEEQRLAANITELVLGGRPVFYPFYVYVLSVNDIGPAVAAPQPVTVYTGEDGQ